MSHAAPPPPHPADVEQDSGPGPDRRGLIVGLAVTAAAGAAGYAIASNRSPNASQGAAAPPPAPTATTGGGTTGGDTTGGDTTGGDTTGGGNANAGAKPLVSLADVPQGGGVVAKEAGVVVTRDGDQVRAFSATCTHQGCQVTSVSGGTINCPCHGSKFDAATGSVVGGPAPSPLPPVRVEVRDGAVFRT